MRVGNAEISLCDLVNQIKGRKMPKRSRAPNCTHLDMDRVFGRHQLCDLCGRSPSIGFLYECRQDWETQSLCDLLIGDDDDEHIEVVKSDARLNLEWLGMSESVIHTAEQGYYTKAQLEKLKTQKKELREIISDQLQASHINDAAARLAALAQAPSNNDGTLSSTFEKDAVSGFEKLLTEISLCLTSCGVCSCQTNTTTGSTNVHTESLSHLPSVLSRARLHLFPVSLRRRIPAYDSRGHRLPSHQVSADHEDDWNHPSPIRFILHH